MFLRCVMLAVLACMCISFNARGQGLDSAARLWKPPAPNAGTPVRIDGRLFVVNASIDYGYYWLLSDALIPPPPHLSVSVQAADGKWLPEKLVATNVTLLGGNRPIWKSVLEYAVFFRPIWLPPGGYGQYQAAGVPVLREGTSIIARIELRSNRGTVRVDTPLRYPRVPIWPLAGDTATP